jgi:hypothetical protein
MRWFDPLEPSRDGRLSFYPFASRGFIVGSPRRALAIRLTVTIYLLAWILVIPTTLGQGHTVTMLAIAAGLAGYAGISLLLARGLERTKNRLDYEERLRWKAAGTPAFVIALTPIAGLLLAVCGLVIGALGSGPKDTLMGSLGFLLGVFSIVSGLRMLRFRAAVKRTGVH